MNDTRGWVPNPNARCLRDCGRDREAHTALYGVKLRKPNYSASLTLRYLHPLHKYSRIIRGILGIARTDGMHKAPAWSVEILAVLSNIGYRVGRSERLRSAVERGCDRAVERRGSSILQKLLKLSDTSDDRWMSI